jgi:predicted O-methyltransferase YrrM
MIIPISNEILDNFSLKNKNYLVNKDYYENLSGDQEYRLYSYLSTFFNETTILDIGTLDGRSAIALSHNETNNVISYDIYNHINNNNHAIYSKSNIKFNIKNVLDDLNEELIKRVKIVMIDIDHYETIENQIIKRLKDLNFSGLIILDDITKHPDPTINVCMNRLWNNIQGDKYDFTKYGHWSGTGVIVVNDDISFYFS